MITYDWTVRRPSRFILSLSVLTFLSAAVPTLASAPYCSSAPSIGLDETLRGDSRTAGEPDCFRLETPAVGLLMLDLAVPGTAAAEPRLSLLGPRCERSTGVGVIDQSASHLLVASDASRRLTVCVGAQDPRQALGGYKLRTTFVAAPTTHSVEQVEVEPDPFSACARKVEQVEVEPDPFSACARKVEQVEVEPDPFSACAQKVEQVEVEPDPFSACARKVEQVEVEPDPFSGADPWDALCHTDDVDDHSDSLLCATAIELGDSGDGVIDNGWGDDQDVFVFELTASRTIEIETSGEADTFGGLYDRRGQRLAASDGNSDGGFRLVKTLQPGLYFVRVEGIAWSQGAYTLAVNAVERPW